MAQSTNDFVSQKSCPSIIQISKNANKFAKIIRVILKSLFDIKIFWLFSKNIYSALVL